MRWLKHHIVPVLCIICSCIVMSSGNSGGNNFLALAFLYYCFLGGYYIIQYLDGGFGK